jgi:hypothetical protein
MQAASYVLPGRPSGHHVLWNALIAVVIGLLLGALAAMPYEQLIGLPESACATMRSLVEVIALGSLCISPPSSLVIDVDCIVRYTSAAHPPGALRRAVDHEAK